MLMGSTSSYVVKIISKLDAFLDDSISMNGTEQTILEYSKVARIMGYLDLTNLQEGDVVVIRQYLRMKPASPYRKCEEASYSGPQDPPVVYLKPKESDYGHKITVQQTMGSLKGFDFNFIREK